MKIIYELDEEGINLQETRLNLIEQGYSNVWKSWLEYIFNKSIWEYQTEIAIKQLKKEGLI